MNISNKSGATVTPSMLHHNAPYVDSHPRTAIFEPFSKFEAANSRYFCRNSAQRTSQIR